MPILKRKERNSDKNITNLMLDAAKSRVYGDVDGLSLQNLFFTVNEYFPNCYMFTRNYKDGDNYFDAKSMVEDIEKNRNEDVFTIKYVTLDLGTNEENVGFCVYNEKTNIFARVEKNISESYILYGNNDIEALNEFVEYLKKYYVSPEIEENNIYTLGTNQAGFTLIKSHVKEVEDFDVDKHYNDDFKKEDEKIRNFISEKDKSGLVILHGEKGTGKTTYIRHLINTNPEKKFVTIPANMLTLLGEPSFGSFLMTLSNHVIILEDCENAIRDRRVTGNNSGVSLLLNMTDGLLSDDLGIKFICTFNDDVRNIDSALLRKGRLISKYEFDKLSTEKTNELIKSLGYDITMSEPMTLADIYNIEEESYESENDNCFL